MLGNAIPHSLCKEDETLPVLRQSFTGIHAYRTILATKWTWYFHTDIYTFALIFYIASPQATFASVKDVPLIVLRFIPFSRLNDPQRIRVHPISKESLDSLGFHLGYGNHTYINYSRNSHNTTWTLRPLTICMEFKRLNTSYYRIHWDHSTE